MTQQQLADRIGVTQQDVARFESVGSAWLSKLRAYAAALDCTEQDIIGAPARPSLFQPAASIDREALDTALLSRVLSHVNEVAPLDQVDWSSERRATVAAVVYQLALREARLRGLSPSEVDLAAFDGTIRLAI